MELIELVREIKYRRDVIEATKFLEKYVAVKNGEAIEHDKNEG